MSDQKDNVLKGKLIEEIHDSICLIHQTVTSYHLPENFNYEPLIDMAIRNAINYDNLLDMGASLMLDLCKEQAFLDGNKRTAFVTGLVYSINHFHVVDTPLHNKLLDFISHIANSFEHPKEEDTTVKFVLETAMGKNDREKVKHFLAELVA